MNFLSRTILSPRKVQDDVLSTHFFTDEEDGEFAQAAPYPGILAAFLLAISLIIRTL